MSSQLRVAFAAISRDRGLSAADRAHLSRWGDDHYLDDPIWQRLAAASRDRRICPPNSLYTDFIREILYFRRRAESAASGTDFDLRHNQRLHQWQLELAQKADDLADYYKWAEQYSGIAMFFYQFLQPVCELEELHRREAALFRQRARRQPKSTIRITRQDRRKGRKGFRKVNVFIDLVDDYLQFGFFDEPDYDAVALLTEIAFPKFYVDPEFVRKSLRPSGRASRKRGAPRPLAGKKS